MPASIGDRKNPGYLRGISTGVQGIDYVTGGLQPEQFIVIIGTAQGVQVEHPAVDRQ